MKKLKITKGQFKIDKWGTIVDQDKKTLLCQGVGFPMGVNSEHECVANSQLLCDAMNTANETDLLPSELLKQRNDLLEFVKELDEQFSLQPGGNAITKRIKELINSIK